MPLPDLPFKATLMIPCETVRNSDPRPQDIYEEGLELYDMRPVDVIGFKYRGDRTPPNLICMIEVPSSPLVYFVYPDWLVDLSGSPITATSAEKSLSYDKIRELLYDMGLRGVSDKQRQIMYDFVDKYNKGQ